MADGDIRLVTKDEFDAQVAATTEELTEVKKSVSDGKTLVAAAITAKGVTTAADAAFQTMADNIGEIETGVDTSDATATAAQILSGQTAYVNGEKIIGNIPSKAAAMITPGTTDQVIAAGQYLAGAQTVKGDSNLKPEFIRKGVTIFGVTGTYGEAISYEFYTLQGGVWQPAQYDLNTANIASVTPREDDIVVVEFKEGTYSNGSKGVIAKVFDANDNYIDIDVDGDGYSDYAEFQLNETYGLFVINTSDSLPFDLIQTVRLMESQ